MRLLRNNCVGQRGNAGYWITHYIEKSGHSDSHEIVDHPIPMVVAKALLQVKRLAQSVAILNNETDSFAADSLLYLPAFSQSGSLKPRLLDTGSFNSLLDTFCDYVNSPVDELGRRWYVRTHELRKSFLITLFWCFKFSSLDPARWIAGHTRDSHIDNYIQSIFPGMELTKLEAQYASKQLWNFETGVDNVEAADTEQLHVNVCKHFGVSEINLVDSKELEFWLESAFRDGLYKIEAYKIDSYKSVTSVRIAFRIRGAKNAEKR